MTNDIDRQVAERVMGWKTKDVFFGWMRVGEGQAYCNSIYWHPTSNIEQAMMVVDRMRGLGYRVKIESTKDEWNITFIPKGVSDCQAGWVECETMQEAICQAALAALKAVE